MTLEAAGRPHVTISACQPCDGIEDSILYGELALLSLAMRNRARQPEAEGEEKMEKLYSLTEEEIMESCEPQFPKEQAFPVLLLSYVGRQHGRFFYASMNGSEMIIRQSKLYSFENRGNAPLDLFTRILLSCPLQPDSGH